MGIACRKWVTFHGLALNVTTDLVVLPADQPVRLRGERDELARQLADRTLDPAAVKPRSSRSSADAVEALLRTATSSCHGVRLVG